jgi:hypothetical protein
MSTHLKELKQKAKQNAKTISEYKKYNDMIDNAPVLFKQVRDFSRQVGDHLGDKEYLGQSYVDHFGTDADNDLVYDMLGWSNDDNTHGRRIRCWCTTAVLNEQLRKMDEDEGKC